MENIKVLASSTSTHMSLKQSLVEEEAKLWFSKKNITKWPEKVIIIFAYSFL